MVRVARLELTASWSRTMRATNGVVPLQEACHKDDALYQAIQRHFEQEAKEQRPDPLGESAEHFLWETGLFEEPIRKEEGKDPARPNCRHFRVML